MEKYGIESISLISQKITKNIHGFFFFLIYMLVLTGKKKSEICYEKQEDGLKSKEGMPETVKTEDSL